jgi:hypothetical protein
MPGHRWSTGDRLLGDLARDCDRDAATDAGRRRALLFVRRDRTLRRLARAGWNRERVVHPDTCNAKHAVRCTDIAFDTCRELVGSRRNLTRLQRACKSAEQSTSDGRDYIVECREDLLLRLDSVELLDRSVNTKADRLPEGFHGRMPQRTLDPSNANAAGVDVLGHLKPSPVIPPLCDVVSIPPQLCGWATRRPRALAGSAPAT